MADPAVSIFLICDYSILRSALRTLIESEAGLSVVGEASDIKEASTKFSAGSADLVLIDLAFRDESELSTLAEEPFSNLPILMLTGRYEVDFYQNCLKLGISGLVSKQSGSEVLFKAISKVAEGELWFDREIMRATIQNMLCEKQTLLENGSNPKTNGMTEREKQVVELICKGLKNKGIAEQLFITETTVRHHLTSVFNKLEVASRLELVIYAFKHNLIKVPTSRDTEVNGGAAPKVMHA